MSIVVFWWILLTLQPPIDAPRRRRAAFTMPTSSRADGDDVTWKRCREEVHPSVGRRDFRAACGENDVRVRELNRRQVSLLISAADVRLCTRTAATGDEGNTAFDPLSDVFLVITDE